jgi:serine protease Do
MKRAFLASLIAVPGLIGAQPVVSFESEKGGKPLVASTVLVDGGYLATVAVVGAKAGEAHVGKSLDGPKLDLAIHDPVSRLTLLKLPAGVAVKGAVKRGNTRGLDAGDAVYLDAANKDAPSRVVSWENKYRDNVLPLALMRVHHPGDVVPPPGTPLFDAAGALVAVCHQAAPDFGRGTYALPVEVIERVEKDLKARGRVVRCWIGIVMEVKHAVPSIMTVRPESPAARAGVKKGDILLSVGGHEVRTYADAVNAFYYLVSGEETVVEVLRGTGRETMQVVPEMSPVLRDRSGTEGSE